MNRSETNEFDEANPGLDDDDWSDTGVQLGVNGFLDHRTKDDLERERRREAKRAELAGIPREEDLTELVSVDPDSPVTRKTRRQRSDRAPGLSADERKFAEMLRELVGEVMVRYGLTSSDEVYELCRNELADILVRCETDPESVSPEAIATVLKAKLG